MFNRSFTAWVTCVRRWSVGAAAAAGRASATASTTAKKIRAVRFMGPSSFSKSYSMPLDDGPAKMFPRRQKNFPLLLSNIRCILHSNKSSVGTFSRSAPSEG